jgi:hypothetical protein
VAEKRDFRMHEKLLLDVIKKQAGSIEKAILEGVMNSIEAGASKVEVGLGPRQVTIRDDGRGFQSRREVEEWFETFGQPHEASENKKWAQFRMGRGQMFAFGRNLWRTGPFTMRVDIDRKLGYELEEGDASPGCRVEIKLYEPLGDSQLHSIQREVERFVRYVDPPVIVRRLDAEGDEGRQVNTPPARKKWGQDSCDEAFITLNDSHMLSIYNMGVLVMDVPKCRFGVGGTIVSRRRLEVNFARNDVIRSCPVWRKIKAVIDRSKGVEKVRSFLVKKLCAGELNRDEARRAPLFLDVSGKAWSAQKVAAARFGSFSIGDAGDRRADKLIQARVALVLDRNSAYDFNCGPESVFTHEWKFIDGSSGPLCWQGHKRRQPAHPRRRVAQARVALGPNRREARVGARRLRGPPPGQGRDLRHRRRLDRRQDLRRPRPQVPREARPREERAPQRQVHPQAGPRHGPRAVPRRG